MRREWLSTQCYEIIEGELKRAFEFFYPDVTDVDEIEKKLQEFKQFRYADRFQLTREGVVLVIIESSDEGFNTRSFYG